MIFYFLFFVFVVLSLRYNWWRIPVGYHAPRVLMYHMIEEHIDNRKRNKWRVRPIDFEKQMSWLAKNGWKTYTISELVEMEELPNKSVCITFDDGFEDNFKNALPILKKHAFKATIYLVPGSNTNHWEEFDNNQFDRLLNDRQIREMLDSGLIEFGSHTLSHCNLTKYTETDSENELRLSKIQVEEKIGMECKAFAYPYGKYDSKHVCLVKEIGYTSATTVNRGFYQKNSPFLINRIGVLGTESFFDFYLKFTRGRNKL